MTVVRLNNNRNRNILGWRSAQLPRAARSPVPALFVIGIVLIMSASNSSHDSTPAPGTTTSSSVATVESSGGLRSSASGERRRPTRREERAVSTRPARTARPYQTDRIGPNFPPRNGTAAGLHSFLDSRGPRSTNLVHATAKGWPSECSLYLAESTIPNSGLGMFTAIDLDKDVAVASPDITIPVVDLNWHNDAFYQTGSYHMLFENYFWNALSLGLANEGEVIGVMSMGFGSLANSHLGLVNLAEGTPVFNTAGLHRSRDPGAGAFCAYHGREARTTNSVPAGAELFVSYGEHWFTTRTPELGYIPLQKDYKDADIFLQKYLSFQSDSFGNASCAMKRDFWSLIVNFQKDSRTLNALPNSTKVAEDATERGVLHTIQVIRSPEWLRQNGKCLDNIRPGRSTIKQAGRGAFATRLIPKGSIVISAPLIHIPKGREVLKMYAMNGISDRSYVRNASRTAGYQLILNYCFGHKDSTVLLSPYGPSVNFINHNREAPNAEFRWADPSSNWFNHSAEWLETQYSANLAFDFIATRDIQPGEEVFISYGSAWQEAWDDHVRQFAAPPNSENYKRATELNKDPQFSVLKTQSEQASNPYPSHVGTHCRYRLPKKQEDSLKHDLLRRPWKVGDASSKLHPCEILSRTNSTPPLYIARILERKTKLGKFGKVEKLPGVPSGERHELIDIPRKGIELVDKMYSSDMHLPRAFRHEILIDDEIFPTAWKNL